LPQEAQNGYIPKEAKPLECGREAAALLIFNLQSDSFAAALQSACPFFSKC
jgi:hypothetical protein